MPKLKGMDTWMWVIGGIIIILICLTIFLNVFASMTKTTHAQNSLETFTVLVEDVNRLCTMQPSHSAENTMSLSTIVTELFAAGDEVYVSSNRTQGDRLCINISGTLTCEDMDCPVEVEAFIKENKLFGLLDTLRGNLEYREYSVDLIRTECGVSILNSGSEPYCMCGTDMNTSIYHDYNGKQPVLFSNERSAVLADTYSWINATSNIGPLLENVAGFLGGKNILLIYEENLTNPLEGPILDVISLMGSSSYQFNLVKHTTRLSYTDYMDYDQVWLLTPGFCEMEARNCTDYVSWSRKETLDLLEAYQDGVGVFLITDSGVREGIFEELDLTLTNRLLNGLGYPVEQVNSCVVNCMEGSAVNAALESSVLTENMDTLKINGLAVFEASCEYVGTKPNATSLPSCGEDGNCVTGCPAGDYDCTCEEQGGYLCTGGQNCSAGDIYHSGAGVCCLEKCSGFTPPTGGIWS